MKKLLFLFFTALLCLNGFAQNIIDPLLGEEMARRNEDEKIKIVVIMKSRYDRTRLNRRADYFVNRAERRAFVVDELQKFADASQYDLRHLLAEMQRNGLTTEPTILWMANALSFEATNAAIESLAQRNDIEIIGYAIERNWIPDGEEASPASSTREIMPNVTQVNADQVWALGYTGEGVVVAVIDSGVNYNHLDLADHLWDGGTEFPHHGFDVYNNDNDPMDDHGHGSHCAGTVCGDGTAGSQTGMAPDATLMCIKCLDADGNGGAEKISQGIQWAVEHGCDLFSMSLGIASSTIPERTLLRNTCEAALDAGVVAAIAAGNEGNQTFMFPVPNNVRVPGSCPPPYMDDVQGVNPGGLSCSVSIGAVDYNDDAAYFTSHGPVTWSNTQFADYPYNPGIGLIRPDVCAPGVDVKSLNYESNTGYTTMSGTSMATPCVAGCMALMLSKDFNLSPAEICRILEETAVPLSEGKSNVFGFGRVNALAAIDAVQLGAIKYNAFSINDPEGNNDHKLNPGESVTMSLTMDNITDASVNGVSVILTTENENVTITNHEVQFPTFAPNQSLTVEEAFAFSVSDAVTANQKIKFTIEVYVGGEMTSKFNLRVTVYDYLLRYGTTAVLNDDNGDGLLNPGETADLRIFIDNTGNEMAQTVVGTLSTDYEFVTLSATEKPYGTIGAGLMGYADYHITLDAAAPEDFVIPFNLDLVDAKGRHTETTFNYRNSCRIVFSLHDSYGDGWQGNYLQVTYSDGTPSEQMTIPTGSSATYIRELMSGCEMSLTWHDGQWTMECSFEIAYEYGEVIYENSGGFGDTLTFIIDCTGGIGSSEFCAPVRNLTYETEGNQVVLAWEAPENGTPTAYEVYRETVLLETTTELTACDVVDEGIYNYCVYAVYDNCQSEYVCQEVEVSLCGAIQNLNYTLNEDLLLTLTWEAPASPEGLVEYQVYMDDELLTATLDLTYAFTVTEGRHDINVKTVFEECERNTHLLVCIIGAVQNLAYHTENHSVIVTWDAHEEADEYEVYLNGELIATVGETFYTPDLEAGLATVTVKAVAGGCYALGASVEVCFAAPVDNLAFVEMDNEGRLHFAWHPAPDAEYYEVSCNGNVTQTSENNISFEAVAGENNICVTAHSIYGCDSDPFCSDPFICPAVDGFDYAFNGNEATVTWEGDGIAQNNLIVDGEAFMVHDNSFTAQFENGLHSIIVTPVYDVECWASIPARFEFEVNNTAPEIRFTDVHEGLMATAWTAVDGAIAYNLYRDDELIAENLTETSYNDTEMIINARHCYAVASVFEKGVSDRSEAACADYFTGLGENDGQFSIFPNPTADKVTIQCAGMTLIEVYSVEGKLLHRIKVDDDTYQLDGLKSGVYTLRIHKGGEVVTGSIVKI